MFCDSFGFTGKPFQLTPDPAFYFRSATHRKALSYLGYGLAQGEGFVVVTGAAGTGKTMLAAHLANSIDPRQLTAAQAAGSRLDEKDIIRVVAASFGLEVEGHGRAEALGAIERFLHEEAAGRSHEKSAVPIRNALAGYRDVETRAEPDLVFVGENPLRLAPAAAQINREHRRPS